MVKSTILVPRVFRDLRETGETCSKHRVARLMREIG
jgi:putative transposase